MHGLFLQIPGDLGYAPVSGTYILRKNVGTAVGRDKVPFQSCGRGDIRQDRW